ncbi:mitochondrial import inner membrane translocase subunit TIM16 [Coemansia sp. RSA 2675]|nr:mitochondrial import inner membrane translocase subunit TIM16 [Coemansia sp. RSA 2675]KAJ2693940.1 mitochondrial import inner membrane translocase subunit TIM16 [Coemansia sp. IMI 209128]
MSAPKAIIQMLMTGTRIVGRAFGDAYKQASANSAAARAAAGNMKASEDGDRMTKASGITVDESIKILNIKDANDKDDMTKKFEHLFSANDPKQGGSIYLQSKVIRARERIEMHWAQEKLKAEQDLLAENTAPETPSDAPKPPQ